MTLMRKALAVLLFTSAFSVRAEPVRSVEQRVRSTASPAITVVVDPAFPFLGHVHGAAMQGRAEFEQFLFAEVSNGRLGRAVIVHFEHALPGADFRFRYPRLEMVHLGGEEYLHQSFPAMQWDLFTSGPVKQLLEEKGRKAPGDWLVSRYVRATDSALSSEIILFYLEPAGELPAPAEELGLGGKRRDLWLPIDRRLSTEGLKHFHVE